MMAKNNGAVIGVLLLSVALAECTTVAPPAEENSNWAQLRNRLQALDNWQLRGRVNVRYDNESHTPRIDWQQQGEDYRIRLWGSFNAGNTLITGRPGYVLMEQDGESLEAATPEDLILQQLGYELPVSYLEYWVRGLPAPGNSSGLSFNELNQLVQFRQDDWTVSFADIRQYDDLTLPRRIEVTRPRNDIRLRFVGLNWTVEDAAD
ncbi:MAG: lipoprotein insertase outer membrane protein LolB [Gammaproteobacteria bacterium]